MKKLMIGLLISLGSLTNLIAQDGIPLERFNSNTQKFELENWEINQIIKEIEENKLLKIEVNVLDSLNKSLNIENSLLFLEKSNLITSLDNKDEQLRILSNTIVTKDLIIKECESIHSEGTTAIKSIEWQLKKEKLKSKWFKWSTGATTTILLLGILREIRK